MQKSSSNQKINKPPTKSASSIEITKCNKTIFKLIQRHVYNFLLNKYSVCVLLALVALLVVLVVVNLNETIYSVNYKSDVTESSKVNDDDDAIDAVYTWVNGTDIAHVNELRKFKDSLKNFTAHNENGTAIEAYQKIDFGTYVKQIKENVGNQLKISGFNCYYRSCLITPLIDQQQALAHYLFIIEPCMSLADKYELESELNKNYKKNLAYSNVELVSNRNLSVVQLNLKISSNDSTSNFQLVIKLSHLFNKVLIKKNFKIFLGSYTVDACESETSSCVAHYEIYLLKQHPNLNDTENRLKGETNNLLKNLYKGATGAVEQSVTLSLPVGVGNDFDFRIDTEYQALETNENQEFSSATATTSQPKKLNIVNEKNDKVGEMIAVVKFNQVINSTDLMLNNTKQQFSKLNIVWDLGNPLSTDLESNRFQDNNELMYSFRSVEKYAPWLRNIYLVTNGQIPSWLNLTNKRVKLIKHEEIFRNKTHLPTFNSAAIETHLHRIPGLSKRFLYFNDDVLIGRPIWPDDFYTKSNGFKIYLAWSLPSCNNNKCPNNWIHDGYCDKACNTSDCDFDGGDCTKLANIQANAHNQQQNNNMLHNLFCSPGCTSSWLADRYCDNICNNIKCAYDMGDCGIDSFKNLHEVKLTNEVKGLDPSVSSKHELKIKIPANLHAFYLNYAIGDQANQSCEVKNATYTKNSMVRTMAIMNKFRILTVLLTRKEDANASDTANKTDVTQLEDKKFKIYFQFVLNNTDLGEQEFNFIINVEVLENVETTTDILKTEAVIQAIDQADETVNNENVKPKLLKIENNDLSIDYTSYKFKNQILNKIFDNYKEYLKWSLNNSYLSETGYGYKIKNFIDKFKNETALDEDRLDSDLIEEVLFNKFDLDLYLNEFKNLTNSTDSAFKKRKLLDTFADSLKYVNKMYNKYFGYLVRKVPAHMPHFIDRDAIQLLQDRFPYEFDLTSANRIRSRNDMQYAFSYFYYIISEVNKTLAEASETSFALSLFQEFNLNRDSSLNKREFSLLKLRYDVGKNDGGDSILANCSKSSEFITQEEFLNCTNLIQLLTRKYFSLNKNATRMYKYELLDDSQVYFQMVSGNTDDDVNKIEARFKQILKDPRKFICLNDNINYKLKNEAKRLKDLLEDFYLTLFPLKSEFEKNENENDSVESGSDDLTNFIFIPLVILFSLIALYVLICNCFGYNIDIKKRRILSRRKRLELKREFIKTSNTSSNGEDSDRDDSVGTSNRRSRLFMRSTPKKPSFIL